jgi:hypothetical protein
MSGAPAHNLSFFDANSFVSRGYVMNDPYLMLCCPNHGECVAFAAVVWLTHGYYVTDSSTIIGCCQLCKPILVFFILQGPQIAAATADKCTALS